MQVAIQTHGDTSTTGIRLQCGRDLISKYFPPFYWLPIEVYAYKYIHLAPFICACCNKAVLFWVRQEGGWESKDFSPFVQLPIKVCTSKNMHVPQLVF